MAAPQGTQIDTLAPDYQIFCSLIASGTPYGESASRAGFAAGSANYLLSQPAVKARISELIAEQRKEDLSGIVGRSWIETELVLMAQKLSAASENPPIQDGDSPQSQPVQQLNVEAMRLQYTVLMGLAKLKGLIIERKQVATASMNLGSTPRGDVMAGVGKLLDALEPGQRAKIKALLAAPVDGELADVEDAYDIELAGDTTTGSGRAKKR